MATNTPLSSRQTIADLRSIFSGSVGNLIEYFDWYVYAAFALYFAPVFFPGNDPTAQLLSVAAVFAVGFIMRPVGGWLLGRYADRHGRKAALVVSILAMGMGSLTIALLPGYAEIGIAAPIALVLARLVQGLSLGGEYASSATYLSEIAPPSHRGFYSSFLFATLSLGQLLALLVLVVLQSILTDEQMQQWGWRIPFLLGALAATSALFLRRSMRESPSYLAHEGESRPHGTLRELARNWRACLVVAGLTLGGTVAFYAFTTYMQKFLVNSAGFEKGTASMVMAAALGIFVLLQPPLGLLSDRVGRRAMLVGFGIFGSLFTVPIFLALSVVTSSLAALALIVGALSIVSLYSSVSAIAKAELFPVNIRALGVGVPYALTVSIFGGSAEYVALQLKAWGHESLFFWYVATCIFVSLCCFLVMRDTKAYSQIDKD
ncbi:MFS transporter [Sphingorhabdus sp.]|uniref:MFS transporter n=1 Tax=Sphingorhabdus sp. TaxID=1902408 RepID=UPI0038FD261F